MVQKKALELDYHFKIISDNWIKILLSWNFPPITVLYYLKFQLLLVTSIIFISNLKEICLRSTTGWRGVVVLLGGLISSHTNAAVCMHFACWPQHTSSPFLEILTQVVRATWGVGERGWLLRGLLSSCDLCLPSQEFYLYFGLGALLTLKDLFIPRGIPFPPTPIFLKQK